MKKALSVFILTMVCALWNPNTTYATQTFKIGQKTFLLDGKPFVVKAAEMHYPRIPRPYWEHRIQMCKALGMNTICIYVFWNIHEQREGEFNFTENNDVAAFCRLAQKNGMYIIVRPGPYVCAEWEMGGLPWWLLKKKDIRLREQDPYFMERVKLFEQKVGEQLAPFTQKSNDRVAIAELYLQNTDGQRLSRETWTTKYADSEEEDGNHTADKVFDLQESTYWQTEKSSALPHLLVINLGSEQTITALEYLPRAEQNAPGCIKDYRIFIY